MAYFLLEGLLPDFAPPVRLVGEGDFFLAILFCIYIIIGSITVMNMLTGMLVQVVSGIAEVEKEEMNLAWVKVEIERVMKETDVNCDGGLSKSEVAKLLIEPESCRVMQEVGVDVIQLVEVAEFHIFKERDEINFNEFLDLVLQLRQAKAVCLRDIIHLQQYLATELAAAEARLMEGLGLVAKGQKSRSRRLLD